MIERAAVATGVPRHVAIIMDGNRRWARANGLPALEGHRRGMQALERTVDAALRVGIGLLTVYAFSEENWSRADAEVLGLFGLAEAFARDRAAALAARGVRVRVIGRRDRLPRAVVEAFAILETATAAGTALTLTIAVDYGARAELREACQSLAREVAAGRLDPEGIDEDGHRGPAVDRRHARPGPGGADRRRAAALELPALPVRLRRAVGHARPLARVRRRRAGPRDRRLRRPRAPLRPLSARSVVPPIRHDVRRGTSIRAC